MTNDFAIALALIFMIYKLGRKWLMATNKNDGVGGEDANASGVDNGGEGN